MEKGKEAQGTEQQQQPVAPRSCRTKSNPDASFIQDMKDHFQEFVSASMEDHKNCLINTFGKMFGKAPKEDAAASTSTSKPGVENGVLAASSK